MTLQPEYYLLRLDPSPRTIVALMNRAEDYRCKHRGGGRYANRCEISFLQEGSLRINGIGSTLIHEEGCVRTVMADSPHEEIAVSPVVQELHVRFSLAEVPIPISEAEAAQRHNGLHQAILPAYVSSPAVCERVASLLKTMIALEDAPSLIRDLKLRTCLYECFTILTDYAVTTAQAKLQHLQWAPTPHTRKACRFLEENLAQNPTVLAVAEHVGIGYDHLKKLFQRDMHMTIKEYANRLRIRRVEQLITVENMTLEAAGRAVGIRNPNYISKLFHRYAGVSASEYRRIYQERKKRTWSAEEIWTAPKKPMEEY